jgi:hypothetical protein
MKTAEFLKIARRPESTQATQILGAEVCVFDSGDYPIQPSRETIHAMLVDHWELKREFVLTHSFLDLCDSDRSTANGASRETCYPHVTGELS